MIGIREHIIGILRVVLVFTLFSTLTIQAKAKDIIVRKDGRISTIKQALLLAENGDRIVVHKGVYAEGEIEITKTVTISGLDNPVIDGEGKYQIMYITADNVIIENMVFVRSGISYVDDNAAVKMEGVKGGVIRNNRFKDNFFSIYLAKSHDCLIKGNHITASGTRETSSGNGIHLWNCNHITIEDNYTKGNRDGIYFEFVKSGLIRNNVSEQNLRYGLHFMFSDSCTYQHNTFEKNGAGVAVMYTHHVIMEDNDFKNNWGSSSYGLLLKEIFDSEVNHNRFYKNSIGIYSEGSNRVQTGNNDFIQNGWAIKIMANSMYSNFTGNNFIDNAFDVATNSLQNNNNFNGNYWTAYKGYDLDHDGVGDIPYRPVRLFSIIVEQRPPSIFLLRSMFIHVLEVAERVMPALTPETLTDEQPMMKQIYDTTK